MSVFTRLVAVGCALALPALPVKAQTPSEQLEQVVVHGLVPAAHISGTPARLDLKDRMDWYHVPAISIAVIDGGKLVFARAYGDGVSTDTLFQAASLSKPVTAVGVMRLVERGQLDLDADVRNYLTSWVLPEGAETPDHPATIRGILAHTAGFTVHGFRGYGPGEDVPSLTDVLDGRPPANSGPIYVDKTPGGDWRYSGGGYVVLQQLLEDVTGEKFSALMQAEVLDPSGMTGSSFAQLLPAGMQARQAKAHDYAGQLRLTHIYPEEAPAGLWTTPSELSTLLISVMASVRGEAGILTPAAAAEMVKQQTEGMGLGFASDGAGQNLRLSHGGSNQGFKALMFAYPNRGQGFVLMTNGDGGTHLQLEVARALAAHYSWPEMAPKTVEAMPLGPSALDPFVGTYHVDQQGFDIEVTRRENGLVFTTGRGSRYFAMPTGHLELTIREDGSTVKIEPHPDGSVVMKLWGMTAKRLAPEGLRVPIYERDDGLSDEENNARFMAVLREIAKDLKPPVYPDPMLPPWQQYPDIGRYSIGWRMGSGQTYWGDFWDWFGAQSGETRAAYMEANPEPEGWEDFYELLERR